MFFQIDDQLTNSRKHRSLADRALEGDMTGFAAIGLWTMCGAQVQASLTDGVISRADLLRIVLNTGITEQLLDLLVESGLWHEHGHTCKRCEPVEPGFYRYHDWWEMGYERADRVTVTRAKRKELKDREIINAVWARDCRDPSTPTEAYCRYCSILVKRKDSRGPVGQRPHLDHVDPTVACGARNIVVSCGDCNRKKGQRTPEQADMTLLPAPRQLTESTTPSSSHQGRSTHPTKGSQGASGDDLAGRSTHPDGGQQGAYRGQHQPRRSTHPDGGQQGASGNDETTSGLEDGDGRSTRHHQRRSTQPERVQLGASTGGAPAGRGLSTPSTAPTKRGPNVENVPTTCGPDVVDTSPPECSKPETVQVNDENPLKPPQPLPGESPPTKRRPNVDQTSNQTQRGIPARATRAYGRLAGSGQGDLGLGRAGSPPPDQPTSQGEPGRKRRRRSRGRGKPKPYSSVPLDMPAPDFQAAATRQWDAGEAPHVPTAGDLGSPFYRWTGPPAPPDDESVCHEHGLHQPCRACVTDIEP